MFFSFSIVIISAFFNKAMTIITDAWILTAVFALSCFCHISFRCVKVCFIWNSAWIIRSFWRLLNTKWLRCVWFNVIYITYIPISLHWLHVIARCRVIFAYNEFFKVFHFCPICTLGFLRAI